MLLRLRARLGRFWEPILWTLIASFGCLTIKALLSVSHNHPRVFSAIYLLFFASLFLVVLWYAIALYFRYSRYNKVWNEKVRARADRKEYFYEDEGGHWVVVKGKEEVVANYNELVEVLNVKVEYFGAQYEECLMVAKKLGREILWFITYPLRPIRKIGRKNKTDKRDDSSVGQVTVTEENAKTTLSSQKPASPSTPAVPSSVGNLLTLKGAREIDAFVDELKRKKAGGAILPPNNDRPENQIQDPDAAFIVTGDSVAEASAVLEQTSALKKEIDIMTHDPQTPPPATLPVNGAEWIESVLGKPAEARKALDEQRQIHADVRMLIADRENLVGEMLQASLRMTAQRVLLGESPASALRQATREISHDATDLDAPSFLRKNGGNGKCHEHAPVVA